MRVEPIFQIEEALDQLEHTFKCRTEYLVDGKKCACGVEAIRDALSKYRTNVWQENRSG